jgi:hypothetical protein
MYICIIGDQSNSLSKLQKAKNMIGNTEIVTDNMIRTAVEVHIYTCIHLYIYVYICV